MRGNRIRSLLLPLLLAAGLGACASNGVQPGIVYHRAPSAPCGGRTDRPMALDPAGGTYNSGGPRRQRVSLDPGQGGTRPRAATAYPAPGRGAATAGRVVSIREVGLAGAAAAVAAAATAP